MNASQTGVASSGYRLSEVPHFVQYVSPVGRPSTTTTANLPLGILVHIFSHLHDIGDIARVTRTSRLFKYVALPQLYEKVALQSRSQIKYVDGRPQGFGGGSPFSMALNGLATQGYVSYMKELRIFGDLNEPGNDEFARGRVPDTTNMLNTVLRIIVDRAERLDSFAWELSAKPTKTFYQGLAARPALTKLTLKFSASCTPRPTVLIPAMPSLRLLKAIDIDPLCYPDDLSLLMLGSKALEDVRLHFSPRMRSQAEPVHALQDIYHRCFTAGYAPKVKHLAIQNYFGKYFDDIVRIYEHDTLESICFLNMFGGSLTSGPNVFIDDSWRNLPKDLVNTFPYIRFNEPAVQHVAMLANPAVRLEKFYCVNDLQQTSSASPSPITPETSPGREQETISLGREYIHALTHKHGDALRHVLLCDQWILTHQEAEDIVQFCPNIEQLAIATEEPTVNVLAQYVKRLPKLQAMRLFESETIRRERRDLTPQQSTLELGYALSQCNNPNLRYLGIGSDAFYITGHEEAVLEDGTATTVIGLTPVSPDDLQHVAIWSMDRMDIITEPSHVT